MLNLKILSYMSNSIARQDRTAESTCAAGTSFRSKTIRSQKDRQCALEASMGSWPHRRNSLAIRENGKPTTSRSLDEWLPLCKMAEPLSISRKFRALPAGLWTVTRCCRDQSICKVVRLAASPFGISRLRVRSDRRTVSFSSAETLQPKMLQTTIYVLIGKIYNLLI